MTQPLLVLQLTRAALRPLPSREYALHDGRLIKTTSACKRTSQQLMALGVLGALAHRPALGWMRAGMALLARLAARDDDALSQPAAQFTKPSNT